jgi:hypothetical protein
VVRVEEEVTLRAQDGVEQQEAHQSEEDHGERVGLPGLLVAAAAAEHAVEAARHDVVFLAGVDPCHVAAKRIRQRQHHDDVKDYLANVLELHQSLSPRNRA